MGTFHLPRNGKKCSGLVEGCCSDNSAIENVYTKSFTSILGFKPSDILQYEEKITPASYEGKEYRIENSEP